MNHIRLPGVFQFLARSVERPADGANCRIIENTYGNEPKNREQVRATPRVYPAGGLLVYGAAMQVASRASAVAAKLAQPRGRVRWHMFCS